MDIVGPTINKMILVKCNSYSVRNPQQNASLLDSTARPQSRPCDRQKEKFDFEVAHLSIHNGSVIAIQGHPTLSSKTCLMLRE